MLKNLLPLLLLIYLTTTAQTTPIPDANFEQFLVDEGIDTNGVNGTILVADANAVTDLNVNRNDITDFTGLEAFINIVTLNLGQNQVATIPLTTLTALEELNFARNTALTTLNLSQNLELKELVFNNDTAPPLLTTLDLSNNIKLENLNVRTVRSITSLTLPVTPTLTDIYVANLSVPTIDLSELTGDLKFRIVGSNLPPPQLVNVILPNKKDALKDLELSSIDFPDVDVSEMIGLERFQLSSTFTETVTLPSTNTLTNIRISVHELNAPISFASVPQLQSLRITSKWDAGDLKVDLSQNPELTDLTLTNNNMLSVDVTNNTKLTTFRVYDNSLTALDVTQNHVLKRLEAYQNQLPSIDLSQNIDLQWLNLSQNLLPSLDITNNANLESINIANNLFTGTGLDLTQNIELNTLNASFNQIESLDITQNYEIDYLTLNDNLFTGTDILDQFYVHYQNRTTMRINLNVENNKLSGRIPDFFSPFPLAQQTRRNEILFSGNAFEFGDFEDEHLDYISLLSTLTLGSSPDFIFRNYTYAPQGKVNAIENPSRNAGESITLTTMVRGEENHYKWFKDGAEITDAPDAPEYTITDLNTCDAGVYHSEITSDLVPFENSNPPGTDGRNLLLVRNDITLTVNATKGCVTLDMPLTNVPINSGIQWNDNPGACGYKISVGTTSGNDDLLPLTDVGEVTVYNHPTDFASNQDILVTIIPYYDDGDFTCTEQTFRTNTTALAPECTSLSSSLAGRNDVAIDANIEWEPANGADTYDIVVGTTSGGSEIFSGYAGNNLFYNPSNDFTEGATIYVTIIPRNGVGPASGCLEESFMVQSDAGSMTPACTSLTSPVANNAPVGTTQMTWDAVANATGYRITITGTANNNVTDVEVAANSYTFTGAFVNDETATVRIIPFKGTVNAVGCADETFTIESAALTVPSCTSITSPVTTDAPIGTTQMTWDAVANTTGYRISISGTANNNVTDVEVATNSYTFTGTFVNDETATVSIIPFNGTVDAVGCADETFTIESAAPPAPLNCTSLVRPGPIAGDSNVGRTNRDLFWEAVTGATGYRLDISVSDGLNNITQQVSTNSYTFPNDFVFGETVNVLIFPLNTDGEAVGCTSQQYTIEPESPVTPACTSLAAPGPVDNDVDVALDVPSITWNNVDGATGYKVAITSASGNNDLPLTDMNNILTHPFAMPFENGDIVIVTIIPYNGAGDATGPCIDESFTIVSAAQPSLPSCSVLVSSLNNESDAPVNTTIAWEESDNADGYRITIRTESNDIVLEDEDVGLLTTYTLMEELPYGTTVYVTITPYNVDGDADSCGEHSFTTAEEQVESEEPAIEDETKYGFSPDGDGINEYWHIDHIENHPQNVVTIYNRWGDAVFKVENYDNGGSVFRGDANLKTKMGAGQLPSGTYFFDIQMEEESTLGKTKGCLVIKR